MYDHVFDMDSTQEEVFDKVGDPVLNNILDGFNGTIMAYGQTSSGKTHTMQGYDLSEKDNRGIMPRIVNIRLYRSKACSLLSKNLQKTFSLSSRWPSFKFIWKKLGIYWILPKAISKSDRISKDITFKI
jgi:hypothetical protein